MKTGLNLRRSNSGSKVRRKPENRLDRPAKCLRSIGYSAQILSPLSRSGGGQENDRDDCKKGGAVRHELLAIAIACNNARIHIEVADSATT